MAAHDNSTLVIAPLDGSGEPFSVGPDETAAIGRGEDCAVRLGDRHVSMLHAEVRCRDGAWCVTDLDSHNGTFINRWKLAPNEPVIVHDGDELTIGACGFELRVIKPDETPSSGSYATRASIFGRLRDERQQQKDLAWQEFRDRYAPVIVGFSRNAGLRAQDAEDVLQDVMMGFYKRSADFEYDPSKGRFRGYLKRATLNAIRKRARAAGPAVQVPEGTLEEQADEVESHWEKRWSEQIFARAMAEARRRVDEQTFEAFELYGGRGVGAREVAARLCMTVNGVHQAKSRVLGIIRAIVERLRADEG